MTSINDSLCGQLLAAAQTYDTPLYIYNADKIKEQYEKLESSFAGISFKIKYAVKANSNINILKLLKSFGSGLDTVSLNEAQLGLQAGYSPEDILYTPNGVSYQEILQAVDMGLRLNIDNISMLERLGSDFGNKVPVCLRINPHLVAGGNTHIQTGHIDSKFGISIHQLRHVLRVVQANNIHVEGVHMHTGSDILDAGVFLQGLDVLLEVAQEFKDLSYIDFGSGFKVPYKTDDVSTDVEALGKAVTKSFQAFCKNYGKELELWSEPGKYLVSEAGYLLVKVNVVKTTVSSVFAGVDSGLNHLLRPMLYDAYHHIENISNRKGTQRVYTVVGNICETDTLGYDRKLNEVSEGDILAVRNAGAYGFAMSSQYNSRFRPAEAMIINGETHLIRERENFEDLLRKQINLTDELLVGKHSIQVD